MGRVTPAPADSRSDEEGGSRGSVVLVVAEDLVEDFIWDVVDRGRGGGHRVVRSGICHTEESRTG